MQLKEVLEKLETSDGLCEELSQNLERVFKRYFRVLNCEEDDYDYEEDFEKEDNKFANTGDSFHNARERFGVASSDFIDTLDRLRALGLEVADKLPDEERNLKPSNAFSLFLNEAIEKELIEELAASRQDSK